MEYLEALAAVDFGVPCPGRTFCSICRHAVCQTCCPAHAASQHGVVGGAPQTIEVSLLEGRFPAVTALGVRIGGLGYKTRIQRVQHQGTSYVMLGRQQPNWNRAQLKGRCNPCQDRIQISMEHCSPTCKLAAVHQGQSRDIIQSLVSCDFTRTHFLDRFCTSCRRAFSSAYCPDHGHHHAAGEDFRIFTIVREDGWVLIPEDQLPLPLVSRIKRVLSEDGVLTVPVRPRLLPNPQGGPRLCTRCEEGVEDDDSFCSIRCKT